MRRISESLHGVFVNPSRKELVKLLISPRDNKRRRSSIIIETLTDNDKQEILDLEGRILDIKRDLISADANEKEDLQQDIESIKQQIDGIKQSAQESIQEMFLDADKISSTSGRVYSELYVDPTKREMDDAFERDLSALNYDNIRGFLTSDGHLYIAITEEAELIHDQLLKLIDSKTAIDYQNSWEIYSTNKYLAVFIESDYSVIPSNSSYSGTIDARVYEDYNAALSSNRDLSYLEFDYDL